VSLQATVVDTRRTFSHLTKSHLKLIAPVLAPSQLRNFGDLIGKSPVSASYGSA
jgi:hypothetical protein